MKALVTADLHLTSRPGDEYRWSIFSYLRRRVQKYDVDAVILAGDITDLKDNHPARLVNRLVDELSDTAGVPWYLLMGNHDYIDPGCPFLKFVSRLPGVEFAYTTTGVEVAGERVLLVPHCRRQHFRGAWGDRDDLDTYDLMVFHQTFDGARNEQDKRLEGLTLDRFETLRDCAFVSGDVHVPQQVGPVLYCGAPHPIRFGDHFQPRVLLYDGGQWRSLLRTTIRKQVVRVGSPRQFENEDVLTPGDHVRVIVSLPRAEFVKWDEYAKEIREIVKRKGVELHGLELVQDEDEAAITSYEAQRQQPKASTADVFRAFCDATKVPKAMRVAGRRILERSNVS